MISLLKVIKKELLFKQYELFLSPTLFALLFGVILCVLQTIVCFLIKNNKEKYNKYHYYCCLLCLFTLQHEITVWYNFFFFTKVLQKKEILYIWNSFFFGWCNVSPIFRQLYIYSHNWKRLNRVHPNGDFIVEYWILTAPLFYPHQWQSDDF